MYISIMYVHAYVCTSHVAHCIVSHFIIALLLDSYCQPLGSNFPQSFTACDCTCGARHLYARKNLDYVGEYVRTHARTYVRTYLRTMNYVNKKQFTVSCLVSECVRGLLF